MGGSDTLGVSVRNDGPCFLRVTMVDLTPDSDDELSCAGCVAPSTEAVRLRPGESVEVLLRHVPADLEADRGTLVVLSDDPGAENALLLAL